MGKNLRQQARGKGGPRYRSPGHRYLGNVSYAYIPANVQQGVVEDIVDAPGRYTPLAVVNFGGKKILHIPSQGLSIGQTIGFESPDNGNILELAKIPEGTKVYNLELTPRDGGRICRSSGASATVISKERNSCTILLPSGAKKIFNIRCRATVGAAAGSGRTDRPFMRAGTKYYAMRALNRMWPHTKGVAMNPVDHPFGGKAKPGRTKSVSRNMPPGRKVGAISPRRIGKKKGKA